MTDLRDALRSLRRARGLVVLSVLSLAVGIGANSAVFTVVNAMLFKPLPVEDPQALVAVYTLDSASSFPDAVSYPDYQDYARERDVFTDLVGHYGVTLSLAGGGDRPEVVWGELVTGNYFEGLRVRPALGRVLAPSDDRQPGAHPVAVLSHGYWERRFGRDPGVIGTSLRLNGHEYTVIGVAAYGFSGTRFLGFIPDIWLPMAMQSQVLHEGDERRTARGWRWLNVNGRLRPGTTIGQAAAALTARARQLARDEGERSRSVTIKVVPAATKTQPLPGGDRVLTTISTAMMSTVGLALLVACTNVASLLMARATARRREIAIRLALGASRGQLIRLLLLESLALAIPSGVLGLLVATWLVDLLGTTGPPLDFPTVNPSYDLAIDGRVVAFTTAISVATAFAFGLLPAVQASRTDVSSALKGGEVVRGSRVGWFGARHAVIILQVALSLVLLVCAGLFVRSAQHARHVDPGFETRRILMASVNPTIHGYEPGRADDLYRRILERVSGIPGVESVSLALSLPLDDSTSGARVFAEGDAPPSRDEHTDTLYTIVAPRYFETMGTPVLAGRGFDDRDVEGALRTAVVNEAMARRHWPNRDPLGQRFRLNDGNTPWFTVVGVVRTGKYLTLGEEARPFFFLPLWQHPVGRVRILARTAGDPERVAPELRAAVAALDATLPLFGVRTMQQFLERSMWGTGAAAGLLGSLGLFTLALALLGIHGVMAWSVAQRTREIGIRLALGADAARVLRSVLARSVSLALGGTVLGAAGSLAVTRLLESVLLGVRATDPLTLVTMVALLILAALVGGYLPARRASRVDPAAVLRLE